MGWCAQSCLVDWKGLTSPKLPGWLKRADEPKVRGLVIFSASSMQLRVDKNQIRSRWYTRRHIKFNFLHNFCIKILLCEHYFSPLNTFMIKGKDPDLLTNGSGSGSGRPKKMRILRIQIRIPTLVQIHASSNTSASVRWRMMTKCWLNVQKDGLRGCNCWRRKNTGTALLVISTGTVIQISVRCEYRYCNGSFLFQFKAV